jgi:hypothetical protein
MNDHAETKQIKGVIQDYIDGTFEADVNKLRGVFHKQAVMNGYLGDDLVLAGPDVFIQNIASAPSMKSNNSPYMAEIESIRIEGRIASVILSESGFYGNATFVDHFHLIKDEGTWKIISKLFTTL